LAVVLISVLEVTVLRGVLMNATLYFIQLLFFLSPLSFCSRSKSLHSFVSSTEDEENLYFLREQQLKLPTASNKSISTFHNITDIDV
jgi:hypothetical protein